MQVKKVGYSEEDAQALLERAFGWRTQTFWRGLKKEEVPRAEAVAATLDFLRELGELDETITTQHIPEHTDFDVPSKQCAARALPADAAPCLWEPHRPCHLSRVAEAAACTLGTFAPPAAVPGDAEAPALLQGWQTRTSRRPYSRSSVFRVPAASQLTLYSPSCYRAEGRGHPGGLQKVPRGPGVGRGGPPEAQCAGRVVGFDVGVRLSDSHCIVTSLVVIWMMPAAQLACSCCRCTGSGTIVVACCQLSAICVWSCMQTA